MPVPNYAPKTRRLLRSAALGLILVGLAILLTVPTLRNPDLDLSHWLHPIGYLLIIAGLAVFLVA